MKEFIWYSVENSGDGSAYPIFMESKELAEWHQRHLFEGWGEECIGCLTLELCGEDCVIMSKDIETAKGLKQEMEEDGEDEEYPEKYQELLDIIGD